MNKFTFGTKAQTLDKLANLLSKSVILPLKYFTIDDYSRAHKQIINDIIQTFKTNLIVRSSSLHEDLCNSSNAGHFKTVLNVKPNARDLGTAIRTVINSYEDSDKNNEILIQPMLDNIKYSGVVFTCDIDTMAPYYVINYSTGNDTSIITSGCSNEYQTSVVYKRRKPINKFLGKLIAAIQEIEKVCANDELDIEFAIDTNDNIFIFQVRPIIAKQTPPDLSRELSSIYKQIDGPFSVMSDWNPAEMLGIRPHKLALSLYMYLITDNVWARQRYNYGYRDVRNQPLLKSFAGIPYIDIKTDLQSFIPAKLGKNIADKLLKYYLDKLRDNPQLHDKLEFDIVFSCAHFNLDHELSQLQMSQNDISKIKQSLIKLTNNIIKPNGCFYRDLQKNQLLDQHFNKANNIKKHLDVLKEYGTLPFAGIARSAFIATKILKSLVDINIISTNDLSKFMSSVPSPIYDIRQDLSKLSKADFLAKWGHLRPNTYEITSKKYNDFFDNYFQQSKHNVITKHAFKFTKKQMRAIDDAIQTIGLDVSAEYLIDFIKNAISARETSKVAFTKYVSFLLDYISKYASNLGLSESDISNIDINTILNNGNILESIKNGKKYYEYTRIIKLPELILNPSDVYQFNVIDDIPNFVTQKKIVAKIIHEQDIVSCDCAGKIATIASADPGYDFLFSRGIVGLVTMFGGANSHMVIRCSELGLTAAIGVGEKTFNLMCSANTIEIDSLNKTIKVIS